MCITKKELNRFELEQRRAMALSKSAFFPDNLKGDVASAVIVYDMANRMNISVMEVAQSIYIIYNKPSFSTAFLVARLNQSGMIKGSLKTIISPNKQSCYCSAIDAITGEENIGMTVTMQIAKAEGWTSKKGSKWVTMPELMLRKRSQSFFIKEFYPQVMFGMQTVEEVQDGGKNKYTDTKVIQDNNLDLNAIVNNNKDELKDIDIEVNPKTGEVIQTVDKMPKKPNLNILDGINSDGTEKEDEVFLTSSCKNLK